MFSKLIYLFVENGPSTTTKVYSRMNVNTISLPLVVVVVVVVVGKATDM
jgi:hypothetical protein